MHCRFDDQQHRMQRAERRGDAAEASAPSTAAAPAPDASPVTGTSGARAAAATTAPVAETCAAASTATIAATTTAAAADAPSVLSCRQSDHQWEMARLVSDTWPELRPARGRRVLPIEGLLNCRCFKADCDDATDPGHRQRSRLHGAAGQHCLSALLPIRIHHVQALNEMPLGLHQHHVRPRIDRRCII
jgi:hypothetical protein